MERTKVMEKVLRSAEDIGPTIRWLRKSHSLTQRDLSRLTGLKQQTISAIESGSQQANMKTLFTILSALGQELTVRPRAKRKTGYAPGKTE